LAHVVLSLKNFRSFGAQPATIDLDHLTALIGTNGCGKSTVLLALVRLFGVSQAERRLQPGDFHIPQDADPSTIDRIELMIEVRIEFPELIFCPENSTAIPPIRACILSPVAGDRRPRGTSTATLVPLSGED